MPALFLRLNFRSSCVSLKFVGSLLITIVWNGSEKVFISWSIFTPALKLVRARACVCVYACMCMCVCVLTSIHREGFICLGLEFPGTDQQFCVEDISFLYKSLHRYFNMKHQAFLTSCFILFIH